jgi:hypothetical protein
MNGNHNNTLKRQYSIVERRRKIADFMAQSVCEIDAGNTASGTPCFWIITALSVTIRLWTILL